MYNNFKDPVPIGSKSELNDASNIYPSGMRSTNALCLSIFSFPLGFDVNNSPNVAPQERLVQQPSKAPFRDLK
jgi:hypothetical protein